MNTDRIYVVYQDWDDGRLEHVVAKNRKEARTKVDFNSTHVSWRPWLRHENGNLFNEFNKPYGTLFVKPAETERE